MRYLLDTNAISVWARRGNAGLAERVLAVSPSELCTSVLVEHELLFGFALKPGMRIEEPVRHLLGLIQILPFDSAAAALAAQVRSRLSQKGTPIGPYDILIAATALVHDLSLVTHNVREFQRVEGLRVEDWTA